MNQIRELEDFINEYQGETFLKEVELSQSQLTISYAEKTTLIQIEKEIIL